ncbi:gluconate:H+ symporter [Psychromicrobium lacuslunae]|uniref:GntT/GntP/DsdX family permease n=1 Tax=Psychromicrobium lacuslunae TaxID=1618207 RepID=UPI000A8D6FCE|nr:gluconate:H+ symporter [Psychromicrobium lacuslunae]
MFAQTIITSTLKASEASQQPWNSHDTWLVVLAALCIGLIVLLIAKFKMHPFLALILGAAGVGLGSGIELGKVVTNFETGVGSVLQEVGLLIALGAMLGKLMADSGGANKVVDTLLAKVSGAMVPWTMALVAVIIGLPMFFEIGLVLLLPVIVLVAQRAQTKLMRIAIPALAGLSVLHGLVPPHPGPLIAIQAVNAPLGLTLLFGILVAIPTVIICGPIFSRLAARWVPVAAPQTAGGVDTQNNQTDPEVKRPPSFGITVFTIVFPVLLMLVKAVVDILSPDSKNPSTIRVVVDFIGEPLVAMTLAVLLAMLTFGYAVGLGGAAIAKKIGQSVGPIAAVILIVGAGGGFKQSLIGAGVGDSVAKWAQGASISVLLLGFLIAVALRLATGSATVATITSAGIVAPLAGSLSPAQAALLALAIGAGSLFLSHVNDAGFWLVKELFGLTVGQTFKTWSVMETLISVVGFGLVMLLSVVIA